MSTQNICFIREITKFLIFGQVNLGFTMDFDHLLVRGQMNAMFQVDTDIKKNCQFLQDNV